MSTPTQRGSTLTGVIIGLVVGLGVALAVALYVSKVPLPFSGKTISRTAEQEAQEAARNKDWNPNGLLQPKAPASTPQAPSAEPSPAAPAAPAASAAPAAPSAAPAAPSAAPAPAAPSTPPPAAEISEPASKKASGLSTPAQPAAADPFEYFVQVGAFRSATEAEAQRARLTLLGLEAKVSEREQSGRTVFRVRLGPYAQKAAAERVQTRLSEQQIEHTLVRVQR